ncbi:MAG: twin-arginine translocation signal domain-containing protein [Sphingobacteriales bacterium]|nr:twin-arginine translocation signal domain-containing protein [Sphingobacteriales bacterium]
MKAENNGNTRRAFVRKAAIAGAGIGAGLVTGSALNKTQ